jgi:uncharacterized membrane protein
MRETIVEIFNDYNRVIIFIHVLSAIVWIGGMIAIRVAVHPSMQSIDDAKIRLGKTLMIMGRLFKLVMPFIVLLIVTALLLAVGLGFKHSPLYWAVHVKEAIWTVMTVNFTYMYIKRAKAWGDFEKGDLKSAKERVANIPNLLLPINIFLGIAALYFGVMLRGY